MRLWRIRKALYLLLHNPGLFITKTIAKFRNINRIPSKPVRKKRNGVIFEFDFNYDPEIKAMYNGSYEVETVKAIKKFLRKGDTFIDVGANIGYMSAIALSVVEKTGQVHSFEPVPKYAHHLRNLAVNNPEYSLIVNETALSDEPGEAVISVSDVQNIGWNTIVSDLMSDDATGERLTVPTRRLDEYIKNNQLQNISLIKIDVEGYEFPVLRGLSDFFENNSKLPIIICEITYDAYPLLGITPQEFVEFMKKYDYHAYSIANTNRKIDITGLSDPIVNVVFKHDS